MSSSYKPVKKNHFPKTDPTERFAPELRVRVRYVAFTAQTELNGPKSGLYYGHVYPNTELNMLEADALALKPRVVIVKRYVAPPQFDLTTLPGITPDVAAKLVKQGAVTKEHLYALGLDGLKAVKGMKPKVADALWGLLVVEFEGDEEDEEVTTPDETPVTPPASTPPVETEPVADAEPKKAEGKAVKK